MLMAYHPQSIHESLYESLFQLSIRNSNFAKKTPRNSESLQSLPEICLPVFRESRISWRPTNRWVPNPSKKTRGLGIGWSGTVSAGSAPVYTNGVVVGITLPETNSSHLKMDGWNTILSFFSGKNKGVYNLRFYLRTEPWDFHVFLNFCFHLRLYRFASSLAQYISVGI